MSKGLVISLCDRTGNMVKPWAEAGYECWCYDIAHPFRTPRREDHINYVWGDVRTLRRPPGKIEIVFGFPPCTHTAACGARDFLAKGGFMLRDALETFEACRQIGEWSGAPYMLENPVGVLSKIPHIGDADHTFDPSEYTAFEIADNYTKKTYIWSGNGFIMPKTAVHPKLKNVKPDNRIHKMPDVDDRAERRSDTPMGFARAVFNANAKGIKVAA